MRLFDDAFHAITRSLDLRFKRHSVLAGNVANSETPNFRARDVNFAGELEKMLGRTTEPLNKTHSLHMDITSSQGSHIVFDNSGSMGANGNNVDIDISLGKLSTNARSYQSAVLLMSQKLRLLRMAAQGRGSL